MTENLMNKSHKTTNEKSRAGYDAIKWDKPKKKITGVWGEPEKQDANEFFKRFVKI